MAFTVKTYLPDPIIVVTILPPHDPALDIVNGSREIQAFAARIEGPVFGIVDMSAVSPTFGQVVNGMDIGAHTHTRSPLGDPRIRGIFVGSDEMVKLAVQSAAQQQYGGLKLPLFASLDEAIAFARTQWATADSGRA